jgi:nucleoside-diphosphate-sugar epimerase
MKTVLITGSQGFIGSYLCKDLLEKGYNVIGIDNYSKYGKISRPHDTHEKFLFFEEDVIGIELRDLERFRNVDYIIAGAAMIGGISYFHKYAYDLLSNNERIIASTFDLAIKLHKNSSLKKIVVISSSMVFENTEEFPTPEVSITRIPPPSSTYGFQKLSCEYFCKGALEQYGLPYTIVRPFNCVGVGEDKALSDDVITSGNIELMMSHVLPDLINKTLRGQYPLRVLGSGSQVRCYTNGADIARGICLAMESDGAINEDFNISTSRTTTVTELAKLVWEITGRTEEFLIDQDKPFDYDVQNRVPDVTKAKEILGFEAKISLEESIKEVYEYVRTHQA